MEQYSSDHQRGYLAILNYDHASCNLRSRYRMTNICCKVCAKVIDAKKQNQHLLRGCWGGTTVITHLCWRYLNPLWSIEKKHFFDLMLKQLPSHTLSIAAAPKLNHRLLSASVKPPHPSLHRDVAGLKLRSPIGLAGEWTRMARPFQCGQRWVWICRSGTVTAHLRRAIRNPV